MKETKTLILKQETHFRLQQLIEDDTMAFLLKLDEMQDMPVSFLKTLAMFSGSQFSMKMNSLSREDIEIRDVVVG